MIVVSIGDEILSGDTLNTNSYFLNKELSKYGYIVKYNLTISDDENSLEKNIKDLLHGDVVIFTGGLGPTKDDRTKKVLSKVFNCHMKKDENLFLDLKKRFPKNIYLDEQSTVFKEAKLLKNSIGTAPGFIFEKNGKSFIFLPGVPLETERMFLDYVFDYLKQRFPIKKIVSKEKVYIALIEEDKMEEFLRKIDAREKIKVGIYPSFASLRIVFSGDEKNVLFFKDKLEKEFKENLVEEDLIDALKNECIKKNKTIAFAESCSGGAISSFVTKKAGISNCFLGSVVCYSNELKKSILGVDEETLKREGAVSRKTVNEMINGLFSKTKADYAVAVSGIAGPGGGSEEKPVGTVFIAVAKRGEKIDSGFILVQKDRKFIIDYVVHFAISLLYLRVKKDFFYFG